MSDYNTEFREVDEDEIDLVPLLLAIKKKLALIIIITIACGILAYAGTMLLVKPQYETSFTVYVNNKSDSGEITALTSSDISAAKSLASTYAEIIAGRSVLTEAASKCGLDSMSYKELSGFVDAETSSTTEIITVSVRGYSPENAMYLAQAIAQVAEGQISQIVDGSSMRVVDEPYLPGGICSPNYIKNAAIAAVLGLFAVCGIIVVKELIDDRVKDQDTLESKLGIPVLGFIPDFESAERKSQNYYGYGNADRKSDKSDIKEKPRNPVRSKATRDESTSSGNSKNGGEN